MPSKLSQQGCKPTHADRDQAGRKCRGGEVGQAGVVGKWSAPAPAGGAASPIQPLGATTGNKLSLSPGLPRPQEKLETEFWNLKSPTKENTSRFSKFLQAELSLWIVSLQI